MKLVTNLAGQVYKFQSVTEVLAKANDEKSGDNLAGIAATSAKERVAAMDVLSHLTMQDLRANPVLPESDQVTALVDAALDATAYEKIKNFSVGEMREFILSDKTSSDDIAAVRSAINGEMAAAIAKLMSNIDLVLAAKKCPVIVKASTTLGLPGRLSARLQPNHPSDNVEGIMASIYEGLSYGVGDAVIGINPVFDTADTVARLLDETAKLIDGLKIPTQNCVLSHISTQIKAIERGARAGLIFQSIAGSEAGNKAFGIDNDLILQAVALGANQDKPVAGQHKDDRRFMYFETGQGSELSSNTHNGADQVTLEARCYAYCRLFNPFLVNDVVGFIGPEYLATGKQMIRAGLEDHFMAKLLGLPMGVDACYTNHMQCDQNDLETLTVLLTSAGVNYFMGVPMGDDVMLSYQSTSFHDIASLREIFNLRPAPEFEIWLENMGLMKNGRLTDNAGDPSFLATAKV